MFEDFSILILISIIFVGLGLGVPCLILIFKCLKKKLRFTEKDLQDALLSFKYYSMQEDFSDDVELMDEDVTSALDRDAGIGKYEDVGSRNKKMKDAAKRTKTKVDTLTLKKNRSKIISFIESLMILIHNLGVWVVLLCGIVVVARAIDVNLISPMIPDGAEYAVTLEGVDYYTLKCSEAANLGLCDASRSVMRYSYEVKGYKVRTNQNCKIGGDTSEIWAEECSTNPLCSFKRENTQCFDYCFGGYDTVTRVDLDLEITPVSVIFSYNCDSIFKNSNLNCPYGFIQRNDSYYCLNNDGSINDHWFILDERNDEKFFGLYRFPEIKLCENDYEFTYRTTLSHVDPNKCRLYYGKQSDGQKPEVTCSEIKPIPINSTHNVLYCDTECTFKRGDTWIFPCGEIVPASDPSYINCMYVPTGGTKYGPGCPQFNPATLNTTDSDIKVIPKELTENGKPMTTFAKIPRYIWLVALMLLQCLVLGLEIWLF